MLIRKGLLENERRQYLNLTSAKQLWVNLVVTNNDSTDLQQSRYERVKSELHYFCMEKDESPQRLHERIKALAVEIECFKL